jgi:hypothetical protein
MSKQQQQSNFVSQRIIITLIHSALGEATMVRGRINLKIMRRAHTVSDYTRTHQERAGARERERDSSPET